ncbi:hypothetical protein FQA39_LY03407 [Lamprigera yunnana]|nr:hypothetical protein FQA39_LY03407 [Lamprigera yunnana]
MKTALQLVAKEKTTAMEHKSKSYPNFDENVWMRSCEKEVTEPIDGEVTGTIPLWLNGALFRNGPGLLKIGEHEFKHVFDGMALLQRFRIENGKITFQSRFLQSDAYKDNIQANRIVFTDFGTSSVPDPCQTIFGKFSSYFYKRSKISDNALISIYPFQDELYSFTELPIMFRINKSNLETLEKIQLDNLNIVTHTSHPHVTIDGTVYNLALSRSGPSYKVVRFPPKSENDGDDYSMFDKAYTVAEIPVRWRLAPSYMHSFGITENFFIILEQPLSFFLPKYLINKLRNYPVAESFRYYPNELTKINIISRKSGKLAYEFYCNSLFYFHIINQYEQENHIILDVCSYKNGEIIKFLYLESLRNIQSQPDYINLIRSRPIRLVLPLIDSFENISLDENLVRIGDTSAEAYLQKDGKVLAKWEELCNIGCEMPRVNYPQYSGVKYRYFYSTCTEIDSEHPGAMAKVDTETKTAKIWYEENCYANEPIFVPSPNSKDEDDGVILTNVIWGLEDTNRTGLVVLDAKTFTEIGRVVFQIPSPIAISFHGWYSNL